jgi:hypothetical protein
MGLQGLLRDSFTFTFTVLYYDSEACIKNLCIFNFLLITANREALVLILFFQNIVLPSNQFEKKNQLTANWCL